MINLEAVDETSSREAAAKAQYDIASRRSGCKLQGLNALKLVDEARSQVSHRIEHEWQCTTSSPSMQLLLPVLISRLRVPHR